jgi:hypothetical protein
LRRPLCPSRARPQRTGARRRFRVGASVSMVERETLAMDERELSVITDRCARRAGSAARRRCRPPGRWSPRRRPPNRTCDFHRIRLSMSTTSDRSLARLTSDMEYPLRSCSGAPVFTGDLLPYGSCRVLTGPLRPVDGFPALPGGSLRPRLLRVLRHAPATTADGAPAPNPPTRVRRASPGRFPRSLIRRLAGSAPSCTPGTSPRATATRPAASAARPVTGRARRPSARTRTERPDSHSRQFRG